MRYLIQVTKKTLEKPDHNLMHSLLGLLSPEFPNTFGPLCTSSCCQPALSCLPHLFCPPRKDSSKAAPSGTPSKTPCWKNGPFSAPATLFQVLGFAWRWVLLPPFSVSMVDPQQMHGVNLDGWVGFGREALERAWPPWSLSLPPASHSPFWSWLVAQTALG